MTLKQLDVRQVLCKLNCTDQLSGWPSGLRRQTQGISFSFMTSQSVLVHECGRGFESHFWQTFFGHHNSDAQSRIVMRDHKCANGICVIAPENAHISFYFRFLLKWFFGWKPVVENRGIDPRTSRMLSERSTIWASSPCAPQEPEVGSILWPDIFLEPLS